ncbi:hypothetical protein JIG36_32955 [Actinoplanes sp. LDG1-06]|uniref:Uncharacterized protein n=1 Tax=Paractinoplanes ovalisporus TaxID=2810368 RepID=A0ABS2AKG8_9ACTN|nr:hypothetical protein [Actinoplanes ovalisporus]MBM2620334.1 hypothetical protein [Actinoplanes ovalisporus]
MPSMEPPEDPTGAAPAEGLENWLHDLRTEAPSDPFGRPDDPVEAPTRPAPDEAQHVGRHRAPD